MKIIDTPSPNFGARRDGQLPSMVVLHYTAMESKEAALERLCDPEAEVSAHYLVARCGTVHRLVAEASRAWHAGRGAWRDHDDVNSASIGIEMENPGSLQDFPPYSELQMAALERLLRDVLKRWSIAPENVIGHSDMAPDRKADPGPKFDWTRLGRLGLAASPVETHGQMDFAAALDAIGYPAAPDADRLTAFRLRWRQAHLDGPEDEEDRRIAAGLALTRA